MPLKRYDTTPLIKNGKVLGTADAHVRIREAIDKNQIDVTVDFLQAGQRLDVIAGKVYGDSGLWWVIAAASKIGWGLQVPAGTKLIIPTRLSELLEIL